MQNIKRKWLRFFTSLLMAALLAATVSAPALAFGWFWQEEDAEPALAGTTLSPWSSPAPMEAGSPAPTAAPLSGPQASALTDDGMLRVCLKSLGSPQALDLTLAGVYTVGHSAGFRFERGARIALCPEGDDVLLNAGGLWINVGEELLLTRQAADEGEENGIYIQQSEKDTLYCGDLSVTVEDGALQAVLTIQIEDYLYGVVAYEMSDSFPLEALKAQAVAARTYAMGRKWVSAAKRYDLVDTAADQVFKGYDGQYLNVIEAVDATRGVVGTYQGGFAMCYYTASNGGQTAMPTDIWGGSGDYGYLDTRDDPYDLENPRSLVNSLRFRADLSDSGELYSLLAEGLDAAARAQGLRFAEIRIDRIEEISPFQPKREGSRMYEQLRFLLSVSTRDSVWQPGGTEVPILSGNASPGAPGAALFGLDLAVRFALDTPYVQTMGEWTPQAQNVEVELHVYDQIKDQLALGLGSLDCELISVEAETDESGAAVAFTLSMRRFGHGVGMSQRGAQRMAGVYDMRYLEILSFYYPGMTLERMDWPENTLTPLSELTSSAAVAPMATPMPTPAPLPALEAGETYAVVRLESPGSALNVREAPSTAARVLDAFASGRELIISGDAGDGWVRVRTAELEGYVRREYLEEK